MDLDTITATIVAFVRDHQAWAAPIVAVLAFCESLALLSLLVPATVMLVGIGALLGGAGLGLGTGAFWTICLAGAFGAVLGDWVSYEIGRYYDEGIKRMWPLSRTPELVARAEIFIGRWGIWGVFVGRFFGPLRALVPIVAGVFDLPRGRFQLANIASGLIWSFGLLAPGAGLGDWLGR
jgi:membrane protein DedA with SNARE-associated domain